MAQKRTHPGQATPTRRNRPRPVSADAQGHDAFLRDLEEYIQNAEIKAVLAVNSTDRMLVTAGVIDRPGKDLQTAFPRGLAAVPVETHTD
jgi:hypothetical protein